MHSQWTQSVNKTTDCDRQNHGPPKIPRPTPQNPGMCYHTGQRRIKVADGLNVAHQLAVNRETILDHLGGPNITTRILKSGRGGKRVRRDVAMVERHREMDRPWL